MSISFPILPHKMEFTWSIKENIGHLSDLKHLWQDRFENIKNGQLELQPTDLQISKTDLANHNDTHLDDLLISFHQLREETILCLPALTRRRFSNQRFIPTLLCINAIKRIAKMPLDVDVLIL